MNEETMTKINIELRAIFDELDEIVAQKLDKKSGEDKPAPDKHRIIGLIEQMSKLQEKIDKIKGVKPINNS